MFEKWWQLVIWMLFIIYITTISSIGVTAILERFTDAGKISRSIYRAIDNEEDYKMIRKLGYIVIVKKESNIK